ncbi:MAG: methyltransferase domain-containing protein [Actinomycetota bacterium]|nr:methyltransferase domain-containing protein [Actinomycetota bacterium]
MASNIKVYNRTGFLYDAVIGPISREARDRAVAGLNLPPEGRLLVSGVGSGLDLQHLPRGVRGVGVDLSGGMLRRARKRRAGLGMPSFELRGMDARSLDLPDESFDAVYLPLIVTVAPDGQRILAEAARVAKPGVRLVVLDRFWPEGRPRPAAVRRAGALLGSLATHIDRRFSEIHVGAPDLRILDDETLALGGFLRLVTLEKPA